MYDLGLACMEGEISERYHRQHMRAARQRWLAVVTGRHSALRNLSEDMDGYLICGQRNEGVKAVPLNRIVGSMGRHQDFDAEFRPLKTYTRDRWCSVARAELTGVSLPPVDLIRIGDEYYVNDGNHRVSVARAFGQRMIEARVIEYELAPRLAPDTPAPAMHPVLL